MLAARLPCARTRTPWKQTVGAAFGAKTIQVDRRMVTMGIWVHTRVPALLARLPAC